MDKKEIKYEEVEIKPIAYINDLSGFKFIIEINRNGKRSYSMIVPPNYELSAEHDESLPASAITGHYFTSYQGEFFAYEGYKEKLNLLVKKLSENNV